MGVHLDAMGESIWVTYLYSICGFYNLATRTLTMALEDPRGSAINEPKELTYLQRSQWLTLRSIAAEWTLSVGLNENDISLSILFRN
jgi:hypothetical protein